MKTCLFLITFSKNKQQSYLFLSKNIIKCLIIDYKDKVYSVSEKGKHRCICHLPQTAWEKKGEETSNAIHNAQNHPNNLNNSADLLKFTLVWEREREREREMMMMIYTDD